MKSNQIANGPTPTNPTKPEGEKRPQFFQNVLTGCTLVAGWGLIQTVRAVTKRIFIKDDAEDIFGKKK
jgi:hypothetical protein